MRAVKKFWFMLKMLLMYLRFKVKQSYRKSSQSHIVQTQYGPVRGIKRISCWKEPFYSYERIPFAKPPIKHLRFRDPVPPEPWVAPLDCTKEADIPRQINIVFRNLEGSEDCLYLNVYTNNPKPVEKRPVMVWIYGGGFETGSTSKDLYSPDYFMSENVVLVSIAYRVSILGFLSLDDPELEIPGNAGLKDQIMALKWVRDNISNFGGDPDNVTLFGESAGGASVHYLMLSEQAKGLFHKGIVMSASVFSSWAMPPRHDWAYRLAQKMGYQGERSDRKILKFLMEADSKDLIKNESKLLTKEEKRNRILFPSGPTIEPYVGKNCVLPKEPRLMFKDAWGNSIPLIIGGTSFEGLFAYQDVKRNPSILENLGDCEHLVPLELNPDRDSPECKELGRILKREYFQEQMPNIHSYLNLLSYKFFWHGIHRTLVLREKYAAAPTYLYRFDFDSPTFNHVRIILCGMKKRGVSHGDDLSYLFCNALAEDLSRDSAEYKTIKRLVGLWTQFAATGNPNVKDITADEWRPVGASDRPLKCLNMSHDFTFENLPESRSIEVWNSLYKDKDLLY